MTFLRSLLFNVLFFGWGAICLLLALLLCAVHRQAIMWMARRWASGMVDLLKVIIALRYEVRGDRRLLEGPAIVASKHQSAWDTLIFYLLTRDPSYVMKRELGMIPVYGWIARRQRMIAVDRKGGAAAMRRLLRAATREIGEGRQIVIFPQGTRAAPGEHRPYQPGVAALYAHLGREVVPVALNSGLFWGRRSFFKRPGTIVVEILPPIPPGLPRDKFMAELEFRIETANRRLEAEAEAKRR
jgi:1-acyl-sn-glycerol-3-phosphate acyltransferase